MLAKIIIKKKKKHNDLFLTKWFFKQSINPFKKIKNRIDVIIIEKEEEEAETDENYKIMPNYLKLSKWCNLFSKKKSTKRKQNKEKNALKLIMHESVAKKVVCL